MFRTETEALQYIHTRTRFGSQKSLDRIRALMKALGDPQKQLKFVHVAGTNGKGSVSTMTAEIAKESGYRVGLYTSPYLVRFTERFRVNGEQMPGDKLAELANRVKAAADGLLNEGMECTEFEIVTAIGFCWFAEEKCDLVVLEVGLGGRLDATNVIDTPLCAAIVPVSLDHTAILGNTVEQIAAEKGGIIKTGGTVVCAADQPDEAVSVLEAICVERGARLVKTEKQAVECIETGLSGTVVRYKGETYRLAMGGAHQAYNASCVLEIVGVLRENGFALLEEAVKAALKKARIHGRLEMLCEKPMLIVDGAHNPAASAVLREAIKKLPVKRRIAVMAVMEDKDFTAVVADIAGVCDAVVCCAVPDMPRSCKAQKLAEVVRGCGTAAEAADSIDEALEKAQELAGEDGAVIVCGSLYLVGTVCGKVGVE